jgi:RsmE family RNA methyltransferase
MNLLLLFPEDFLAPDRVRISGRRCRHLVEVLHGEPGRPIRVGLLDGLLGTARIIARFAGGIDLAVQLDTQPPPPVAITLLLALPRPKALRRVLQGVTACGVKRIILFNTARVEKSYWQSPFLAEAALRDQLLLGLEQGCDSRLPEVLLRRRFRPFVEDELPFLTSGSLCMVAHPGGARPCPCAVTGPVSLAVGPEGGFVPFEIDLLGAHGFQPIHLGNRPLRVETAVPALLGRLLPL